jgi:hypothetical protein
MKSEHFHLSCSAAVPAAGERTVPVRWQNWRRDAATTRRRRRLRYIVF